MWDKFKFHSKISLSQEEICGKLPNGFTCKLSILTRNLKFMESVLE